MENHTAAPKVFGLGLSKTGLSSLGEALNLVGVKTAQYPHDETTYKELRAGDYRLSILEHYEGAVDLSVAPFYAQLDTLYPKSKFVLTVREREAWLRSIETHWRLLLEWQEQYPQLKRFHEFISACVFGCTGFNRERFLYVYEKQTRDVVAYFANRPTDLLVMDVCGGEGWERLCPFLGCEIPSASFPHANEWMHLWMDAKRDLTCTIPHGESVIVVDEASFGGDFASDYRRFEFIEHDGIYNGAPHDSAQAIAELERLRERGANYIAFGWIAFWWLDYYTEFNRYLRSRYPLVSESKQLIVFDLRA